MNGKKIYSTTSKNKHREIIYYERELPNVTQIHHYNMAQKLGQSTSNQKAMDVQKNRSHLIETKAIQYRVPRETENEKRTDEINEERSRIF